MDEYQWVPRQRVGTPEARGSSGSDSNVLAVTVRIDPDSDADWQGYFRQAVGAINLQARIEPQRMGPGLVVSATVLPDDLEHAIESIDAAINAANQMYEVEQVPKRIEEARLQRETRETAQDRQRALDERLKALAKPEIGLRKSRDW